MKKIFGAMVALGVGTAAAAEPKDTVEFLGAVTDEAWLEHYNEGFESYGPEDAGNGWAIFGVTVKDLYNREIWYHVHCEDILRDEGRQARESMESFLADRDSLNMLAIFDGHSDVPVDLDSLKKSVPAAVSQAVEACAPHIM